jgi:acyl-CoA-binding protein
LAEVSEQSPEVIDTAMARLGGDVMRRPVADVEEEISAAEEAQRHAKREAWKELQKARMEKTKEEAHAKVEEMKTKLHRPKAGAAA